jgi:selenide,water dikinase
MIDRERRRQVMERSIKLGHCICNPRQPCPCDLFKAQDLCLCAGERPEEAPEDVRLTELVRSPGCASKISQDDLKRVLVGLPLGDDPRVLVGRQTCDDAGVYQLTDEIALVQTVDVFTPNVDDPYTFGQIAAANSLSDVYAMGGAPLTALAVIAFPIESLSPRVMTRILQGGLDKLREAGVPLVGGHSINDEGIKFGFAITGQVHPEHIVTNAGAQPGDWLVLSKPLGVGTIAFARQLDRATPEGLQAIGDSMTTLNRAAAEAMTACGVRCATDVTGFGLLGHLAEVVRQSQVGAELYAGWLPAFPEAVELLAAGVVSGALERNRHVAREILTVSGEVPEALVNLTCDPQTSGGLLMCVPPDRVDELRSRLQQTGAEQAAVIGRITEHNQGGITLMNEPTNEAARPPGSGCCAGTAAAEPATTGCCEPAPADSGCCSGDSGCCSSDSDNSGGCCCGCGDEAAPGAAREQFMAFLGAAAAPGALGLREKELLLVALSVLARCEPCLRAHWPAALKAGLTREELEEAVWLAVALGGAPVMMFYAEQKARLT